MNQRLREQAILNVLENRRNVPIAQLAQEFPQVANVTIRRDVARLAKSGKLERSHGAVHAVKNVTPPPLPQENIGLDEVDVVGNDWVENGSVLVSLQDELISENRGQLLADFA